MICTIKGNLLIVTIGLGMVLVISDNLVPSPPANITTFISSVFKSLNNNNYLL